MSNTNLHKFITVIFTRLFTTLIIEHYRNSWTNSKQFKDANSNLLLYKNIIRVVYDKKWRRLTCKNKKIFSMQILFLNLGSILFSSLKIFYTWKHQLFYAFFRTIRGKKLTWNIIMDLRFFVIMQYSSITSINSFDVALLVKKAVNIFAYYYEIVTSYSCSVVYNYILSDRKRDTYFF